MNVQERYGVPFPGGTLVPNFGGLGSPTAGMTAPNHLTQPMINAHLFGAGAGLQNGFPMANPAAFPAILGNSGARVPVIPGNNSLPTLLEFYGRDDYGHGGPFL